MIYLIHPPSFLLPDPRIIRSARGYNRHPHITNVYYIDTGRRPIAIIKEPCNHDYFIIVLFLYGTRSLYGFWSYTKRNRRAPVWFSSTVQPISSEDISSQVKLSFIVIPLHVWTYSGTRCRASQDHGAT